MITFIISFIVLVSAVIDLSDPVNSGHSRHDLSSYESYKMQIMKSVKNDQAYIPDDEEIRKMFDAAKVEKINRILHRTKRDLIVTGLLIIVSLVLFVTHWRIIRKYSTQEIS